MFIICLLWGLCEATFFPFAPDVIITFMVLGGFFHGLVGCAFVLTGALIGGGCMYLLGCYKPSLAIKIVTLLPGVSPKLLGHVKKSLKGQGWSAIIIGSIKGVPYKAFAIQAHTLSPHSPLYFLLLSIPFRLARFLITLSLSHLIFAFWMKSFSTSSKFVVLIAFWVFLYTFYFWKLNRWNRNFVK